MPRNLVLLLVALLLVILLVGAAAAEPLRADGQFRQVRPDAEIVICWTPERLAAELNALAAGGEAPTLRSIGCTKRGDFVFSVISEWGQAGGATIFLIRAEGIRGDVYTYQTNAD